MCRWLAIVVLCAFAASCARPDPEHPPDPIAQPPELPADPCEVEEIPAERLTRLTPTQHSNTLGIAASLPAQLSQIITELEVQATFDAAHAYLSTGAHRAYLPCSPKDVTADKALCLAGFVDAFGLRLFRRPITDDERATLLARDQLNALNPDLVPPLTFKERVDALAEVMLTSPQFLYVHREGVADASAPSGLRRASGYERAARLSLFLFDSGPDDALLSLAARGELDTEQGLRDAAVRMLSDDRARPIARRFASHWLGLDATSTAPSLEGRSKSALTFPFDSPELRVAMRDEVEALYERVLLDGDGRFATLFTTQEAKVTPALAQHVYGMAPQEGWTVLDTPQRAGLLTRAAFLTQFAGPQITSPIRRGTQLYRNVLCLPLGDPPPDADVAPPTPGGDLAHSTRASTELRTAQPSCQGCHALINPLGFSFEHYDAMGRWRDVEYVETAGGLVPVAVDASTAQLAAGIEGPSDGAVSLSERFAHSQRAQDCHVQRWFTQAIGRHPAPEDGCTTKRVGARFSQTGDLRALLVDLATSAPARFVRPQLSEAAP